MLNAPFSLSIAEIHPAVKTLAGLVALLGTLMLGWNGKADTASVERVDVRVDSVTARLRHLERILERLDERTARMDRYVCRQLPQDLGCP